MEAIINKVENLIKNYKKAGSRGYSEDTLVSKLKELELLQVEFLKLHDIGIKTEEVQENIEKFNKYYNKAKTLFEQALISNKQNLINMANFNLETAMKVIPEFTGNYKELNSFITIVDLIHNTLVATQKPILITFVYNVKLSSVVRTSLGTTAPGTLEDLKTLLENRYKSRKTVSQIQSTLNNFSQKTMNVTTYHEKLLEMITELNELQIKGIEDCNNIQSTTIKRINEDYALNIFKNGLKGELKPTVFASRPKELNEALQLALELEKEFSNNTEQILYFSNNGNRRNNNFNRNRNNFNNNRYNNNRRSFDNNGNTYNNRSTQHNNNNRNNNTNNYNRNNSTNNGNRQNNYNNGYQNNRNYNNYNNNQNNRNYNNRNQNHNQNRNNNSNGRNVHYVQENRQDPEVSQGTAQTHYPEDQQ